MTPLRIVLAYDERADVWYVRDSDVPGLHIEAESFEALKVRLGQAAADLLNSQLRIEGREAVYRADLPLEVIRHNSDDRLRA
ncbi:MAG: DUF1902 domain-containing protein [Pseudomonadota bacterium]|nr:DUF1902 domain-containing protein [Pseudomonadota bacterium]